MYSVGLRLDKVTGYFICLIWHFLPLIKLVLSFILMAVALLIFSKMKVNLKCAYAAWLLYNMVNYDAILPLVFLIARFMGPTWGPSGADRTQVGPMLAPWTLLSGIVLREVEHKLHLNSQQLTSISYPTWACYGKFVRSILKNSDKNSLHCYP